jgi:hypothetical protein
MRWLFLFVLMLNFAYVAWELNRPEDVLDKPIAGKDVPRIVLLSEIGQESAAMVTADRSRLVPDQNYKRWLLYHRAFQRSGEAKSCDTGNKNIRSRCFIQKS